MNFKEKRHSQNSCISSDCPPLKPHPQMSRDEPTDCKNRPVPPRPLLHLQSVNSLQSIYPPWLLRKQVQCYPYPPPYEVNYLITNNQYAADKQAGDIKCIHLCFRSLICDNNVNVSIDLAWPAREKTNGAVRCQDTSVKVEEAPLQASGPPSISRPQLFSTNLFLFHFGIILLGKKNRILSIRETDCISLRPVLHVFLIVTPLGCHSMQHTPQPCRDLT